MKTILASHSNHILLFISLLVSFPLLFDNALEHSFPMGYAGLFTQMAEQIANANFRLPLESPFYGPSGIPFVYPPFGLYLLAIFIKLTGKYFVFLRLLPPLLSLISLIPLFYLTLELSKSALAATITVILVATSPDLYIAHAWSAGIARTPAFIFALTSLFFFSRQLNKRLPSNIILTGVFLGLAFMSHLLYALFCFLWIWWWTLFGKNAFARIKDSAVSSMLGLLTASIWLVPTLLRHGIVIFINAFGSHGGADLLFFWKNFTGLFDLFLNHITPLTSSILLYVPILIGMIATLVKREFAMASFLFFIIPAFPGGVRFIFLLGCIFAGVGLSTLVDWGVMISKGRLKTMSFVIMIVPLLGIIWWNSYLTLSNYSPRLDENAIDVAESIQGIIAPDETYLALIKQDEAEWLPFLFQREPIVSQWGSEWLGKYNEQTYLMSLFRDCQKTQDWPCVEGAIIETGGYPDHLITYANDVQLNDQISRTKQWKQFYANDRYVVWSRMIDGHLLLK